MREAHGVGLAAPQVGVLKRVFAYDVAEDEEGEVREFGVLVNPEIIHREGEQTGLEGCGSRARACWRGCSSTRSTTSTACCSSTTSRGPTASAPCASGASAT